MTRSNKEIPFIRGTVIHSNIGGPSQCLRCQWSGVPTIIKGRPIDLCPACSPEHEDETEAKLAVQRAGLAPIEKLAVPKNSPCPCGSGNKYKKCHMGRELP